MKLPNRDQAIVPKAKLVDYLLSKTHPVGNSKAKFFRKLKFDETNTETLAISLLKVARENDIKSTREFSYGTNYIIEGEIDTPIGKTVKIITVWFIKIEKIKPSFVTAYPV